MSQYEKIKKLYEENREVDLSFYSSILLNLRTHLAKWVEEQDWSAVVGESSDPDFPQTEAENEAKRLLDEALTLLKEKVESDKEGIPFLLKHTETSLKNTYESNPLQFARDLKSCLEKERQILSAIMAQRADSSRPTGRAELLQPKDKLLQFAQALNDKINTERDGHQSLKQTLKVTFSVLSSWRNEIASGSTELKDVFQNGRSSASPSEIFHQCRKGLGDMMQKTITDLDKLLTCMKPHINRVWKTHQLHTCVSRKPENEADPKYVDELCKTVCVCITGLIDCIYSKQLEEVDMMRSPPMGIMQSLSVPVPTPSMKSQLESALKQLLDKHLQILLVVLQQPPMTMMMEKEKGARDSEANNSKKFDTSVGILGGEGLGTHISITAVEIYLCHGQDLATAQEHNTVPEQRFKIVCDNKANQRRGRDLDPPCGPHVKMYEGVRVEEYSRKETKHVYRQVYYAVYKVTVQFTVPMWTFEVQTTSLPVLVRTGAVQAAEHVGVQLCLSYIAKNVLDPRVTVPTSMKIEDIVQMMNERIRGIGGRGLESYEKEFLREKLALMKSTKGSKGQNKEVTLEAFIKDKVVLPSQAAYGLASSDSKGDEMPFSLWRWLHSVINLLEKTIKQPWLDGVIYGFASRKHCEEILMDKPEGTFLLRFSESTVQGNHKESQGGLGLVGKVGGDIVFAPPMEAEHIDKEGLKEAITSIRVADGRAFSYILNTAYDITFLEKYFKPQPEKEPPAASRYLGFRKMDIVQQQFDGMSISSPASTHVYSPWSPPAPSPVTSEVPSEAKRKRPTRQSDQESLMSQPMSPESQDGSSQFYPVAIISHSTAASNIPTPVQNLMSNAMFNGGSSMMELQPIPIQQDANGFSPIGAQVTVTDDQAFQQAGQDELTLDNIEAFTPQDLEALLLQQGIADCMDSEMQTQISTTN